jgi:hypothetical protein
MATYDYLFSITDDFIINHKVNITILQEEIKASTIITTVLHHIDADLDEDTCTVVFNGELTDPEEIELNEIIESHTGELPGGIDPGTGDVGGGSGTGDIIFTFSDEPGDYYIKFKNWSWDVVSQFIFRGTNILGTPTGIKAIIKGEGKLRLYDKTNGNVIFEWSNFDVNDWTMFGQASNLNWPKTEAIVELQGEKDSNYAYISCFMICFSSQVVDNIP